jgi:uncharacterized protein
MSAPIHNRGRTAAFYPAHLAGLPIFRRDHADHATYYAPGVLCVVSQHDAQAFERTIASAQSPTLEGDWAGELRRRANLALAQTSQMREEPFMPECLTLYVNDRCNLRCTYCYADPPQQGGMQLGLKAIAAAAQIVAENCRQKGLPLYLVFHGGGEPTLYLERLKRILALLHAVASAFHIETFRYIATNGVMSEAKAAWLARNFDMIGLSCDGPADIHNSQRRRWDGSSTLRTVERTARLAREEGTPLHVRATITPATLDRQAEIADYVCHQLAPDEIHMEPVYLGGRTAAGFHPDQAEEFAHHLLQARLAAQGCKILLESSGSRLDSIHGPYCNVFRQVLNLVPDDRPKERSANGRIPLASDLATACFKMGRATGVREKGLIVGQLNPRTARFEIDCKQVQTLRQQLAVMPGQCTECFNRYHCAGDCPDRCPLDPVPLVQEEPEPGFRCRAQKAVAAAILEETDEQLWHQVRTGKVRGPHGTAVR